MKKSSAEVRLTTACLVILTGIAIGAALYFLRTVLVPFVVALFLSYLLAPVIDFQIERLRFPRPLAVLGTFILGCLAIFLLWMTTSASVTQMAANQEAYRANFAKLLDEIEELLPVEVFHERARELFDAPEETLVQAVRNILSTTAGSILEVLSKGVLVLVFLLFLVMGQGRREERSSDSFLATAETQIKRFLSVKVTISAFTGVAVGLVLHVLGVPLAFVFGVSAFLLNFIPNVGSIIATVLPLPMVFLNAELSVLAKILAFVLPGVIQFSVGYLLEPKLMGRSLDLHPVTVLMSLTFFGMIWGVIGMFMATPITAIVKILLEKTEYTIPYARLFAGRLDAMGPGLRAKAKGVEHRQDPAVDAPASAPGGRNPCRPRD